MELFHHRKSPYTMSPYPIPAPESPRQHLTNTTLTLTQNTVLKALIAATAPSDSSKPAPYRFTVNSTIVQQGVIDKTAAAEGTQSNAGKRGMHSASGAFWDVNRDGMWTFKYPGAEARGLDVVVSVTWFAMN